MNTRRFVLQLIVTNTYKYIIIVKVEQDRLYVCLNSLRTFNLNCKQHLLTLMSNIGKLHLTTRILSCYRHKGTLLHFEVHCLTLSVALKMPERNMSTIHMSVCNVCRPVNEN